MRQNYQKQMEEEIRRNQEAGRLPSLLLHSCCAPCSSYCLEYLSQYFRITVFYYNPNIYPEEEYGKRVEEQRQLIARLPAVNPITLMEGGYEKERFYEMARGLEKEREGGARCEGCYRLRLEEAARLAARLSMDYFTTTLSISPMKSAEKLNQIGEELAAEYGVCYLNSDFKKKNGYLRSVELSGQYGMYRQYYCGCVFSKNQRDREISSKIGNQSGTGENEEKGDSGNYK